MSVSVLRCDIDAALVELHVARAILAELRQELVDAGTMTREERERIARRLIGVLGRIESALTRIDR